MNHNQKEINDVKAEFEKQKISIQKEFEKQNQENM